MTDVVVTRPPHELRHTHAEPRTTEQVGAASFSDLVRAHFKRWRWTVEYDDRQEPFRGWYRTYPTTTRSAAGSHRKECWACAL
jgi:hypothetical protein